MILIYVYVRCLIYYWNFPLSVAHFGRMGMCIIEPGTFEWTKRLRRMLNTPKCRRNWTSVGWNSDLFQLSGVILFSENKFRNNCWNFFEDFFFWKYLHYLFIRAFFGWIKCCLVFAELRITQSRQTRTVVDKRRIGWRIWSGRRTKMCTRNIWSWVSIHNISHVIALQMN